MGPSLHYILDSFRARGQLQLHVCEQVSGHLVRLSDQSKPHISFVFDLKDHIHKEKGKRVREKGQSSDLSELLIDMEKGQSSDLSELLIDISTFQCLEDRRLTNSRIWNLLVNSFPDIGKLFPEVGSRFSTDSQDGGPTFQT